MRKPYSNRFFPSVRTLVNPAPGAPSRRRFARTANAEVVGTEERSPHPHRIIDVQPVTDESHEVFLCYSHFDRYIAQCLATVLQDYGFSVWWDHALLGGDDFRQMIAERIRSAKVVLALFSQHSVESGWVIDEAGRAHQAGKLVPVLIETVDVPLGFGQLHHCNLIHWNKERNAAGIEDILLAVEHYTQRPRAALPVDTEHAIAAQSSQSEPFREDRFRVSWVPDNAVKSVMRSVVPVYVLALLLAVAMAANREHAFYEWIRLLHIYTGMIVFGGGIFLFIVFRFSDRAATFQERAAVADVARPLFGGWRIAAIAQLATGLILSTLRGTPISGWLIQSFLFYSIAIYFWFAGFAHGLAAAQCDALYRVGPVVEEHRSIRNRHLAVASVLTAWILIMMTYKQDADLTRVFQNVIAPITRGSVPHFNPGLEP